MENSDLIARYDLYENPSVEGSDKQVSLHARVVTDGTVGTAQIAEKIGFSNSVTPGM